MSETGNPMDFVQEGMSGNESEVIFHFSKNGLNTKMLLSLFDTTGILIDKFK